MKSWEKIKITTDKGETVDAVAPIIISASRSTDIPAFYSEWFFNRIKKGYVTWVNPFNRNEQYISFSKTRFIVFWSKNPNPIIPYLPILDEIGINYYFQFTLNDYENENLEPNIPALQDRINTFIQLSKTIGKEKVIWRFDPLILNDTITIDLLLGKVKDLGDRIYKYTNKLVFSFADIYSYIKVKNNLKQVNEIFREFSMKEAQEFTSRLQNLNNSWKLKLATCAEDYELSAFNIEHNRCVDDELIYQIAKNDKVLADWLGFITPSDLTLFENPIYIPNVKLKDKGQRKECGCIISKDIGMYNTCNHLCTYCYANHSEKIVEKNINQHKSINQSII